MCRLSRATLALALGLTSVVALAFTPTASARPSGAYRVADEKRTLVLINEIRRQHRLAPFVFSRRLRDAAREHSADMLAKQYFEHDSPGESFDLRIRHHLSAPFVGENIGWGTGKYATPEGMVNLWMHSAPHRKVLLMPRLRRIGLGIATGRFEGTDNAAIVTADFAS